MFLIYLEEFYYFHWLGLMGQIYGLLLWKMKGSTGLDSRYKKIEK